MNPGWRGNYFRYKSYFLNVMGQYRERVDIKIYIEILLSLATISIFAVFALRPTLLTIAELIKEIDTKHQTLTKMENKIQDLSSAQTLYDRERSRINILLTSIPDKPNPEVFARQIEGLSEKYGPQITEITVGEAVIAGKDASSEEIKVKETTPLPEGSTEVPVSAIFIADLNQYSNLSAILTDFEKALRPVKIDNIHLATITTDEDIKLLSLTLEGRLAYFRNEEEK